MRSKDKQKHKTEHSPVPEMGRVLVYCQECDWSEWVDVQELPYFDALKAIFDARDRHEAESEKA